MIVSNTRCYVFNVRLPLLISSPVVTLSFEVEQYSTEEGDNVTVCVVLSGQTERDVAVNVGTMDGSAQGCSSTYFVRYDYSNVYLHHS